MARKRSTRRSERRGAQRADARLSMRVEGTHEGDAAHVVTESQNISASGVYCTSSHFLPPLSKVDLTIVLPRLPGERAAEQLIKCEGIVVRCDALPRRSERAYQLACAFSGLDTRRRTLLDTFVRWRNLQALQAAMSNGKPVARPRKAAVRKRATAAAPARAARKKTARRRPTLH